MKVRHAELKSQFPEKTFVEICELVAKDWSAMTKAQHAKFKPESDDADGAYCEVERILGHRGSLVNPDAWWFLIKWVGFDDSHNEWLPRCDVSQEAIDEYMALDQEYMCSTNPMAPPERVKGSCQAVVSQTGNFCKNSGPYVCCGDKVYCRAHVPLEEVDPINKNKKKRARTVVDDTMMIVVEGTQWRREERGGGGNCLLHCLLRLSRLAFVTVDVLREMIAKHMRDHFKFFADHISDEDFIDSGLPLFATPEEQMFHDADMENACNLLRIQRFINDGIAVKNKYLGQIAITAFSRMLYPDVPPIFMLQKLGEDVQVNPLYNNPNVNVGLFYSKAEQHYQIIVLV
jgi:hypothetical protein